MTGTPATRQYHVIGMDCARDAAEIERAVRSLPGFVDVKVSAATHVLTVYDAPDDHRMSAAEAAVSALGYRLERIASAAPAGGAPPACTSPGYRRALWTVVRLNAGYGVVEMAGGFLSGSQAVKADALDFLGDGVITLLGLVAIGWSLVWRARAALLQGLFLGALGLAVLGNTVYRLLVQQQPESGLMSVLGTVALIVNVTAAVVLMPHRSGDANVRAVWLFSRNDAIGNLAVVVAAALVAVTATPWPDLVVALIVACLFLGSAWSIIRDARGELRDAGAGPAAPPV